MDGNLLQQKLSYGYAKSAQYIGSSYARFEGGPFNPAGPFASGVKASLNAAFSPDASFAKSYDNKTLYVRAFVDTSKVPLGDILQGPEGTFVLVRAGLTPPVALICPQTLSFSRTTQVFTQAEGLHPVTQMYLGTYPCNVTLKRDKGFSEPVGMSAAGSSNSSASMPLYDALVPLLFDGVIQAGDTATDNDGATWKVDAVNYGTLGYQLSLTPYTPTA
jgi:hypothetical protein